MTTTLTGAGKSADVKKAKLVTKEKYNKASIAGWNNPRTPLREMRLGGLKRLGVIFPYNPTLNLQGSVAYGQYDLTHTNYQPHFYSATQNQQITLGFNFTASTLEEANYMLGFMHFLRTITKMNFGKNDEDFAGMPPPVLEFSCYGDYQFKNVPVVLRSYSYDQTGQEDYVDTKYDTQVPTFLTGFIDIITQYTPGKTLNEFTLQDFANGTLIKSGKGFI
jgi:hypothetical protein|tara:strand:+ start:208 stop:867 length:660 start_codon:yes stop_codon:yes gene_type:complete